MRSQFSDLLMRIKPYLFWIAISLPIFVLGIFVSLEYKNHINYITLSPPYEVQIASQVVGAGVSIFLTYGLVILYRQQAQLQSNQENLMKNEHKPKVELVNASLSEESPGGIMLKLSNSGKGTATNLKARVDIDVDSDIDVVLKPKWQDLTRYSEHDDKQELDTERIFYSSGQYLSPEEGEIRFLYSGDIDARQSNGGSKTVDNTSFSIIHHYFARVNNDELKEDSWEEAELIQDSIDFDRLRVKYSICYNDIDGEEYQRTIMDYLVPVIHGESKATLLEIGMPYEKYLERKEQEIFQRADYDPLEDQVQYHYDVDEATEILPTLEDDSD